MPYFSWSGFTLTGDRKRGRLFARSPEHLDEILLRRNIALSRSKPIKHIIARPIRLSHSAQAIRQLAILVDAGILLPNALAIVADQIVHPQLQTIMHDLAQQVKEGIPLSTLMARYPRLFNHIVIQLIKAGEESGDFARALDQVCTHFDAIQDFNKRVKTALLTPLMTLVFFMLVAGIIVIGVVPRFVEIFASLNQEVPGQVKALIAMSAFVTSSSMVILLVGMAGLGFLLWSLLKRGYGRNEADAMVLKIPFIGMLLQERFLSYTFQTLSLLMQSGVPIVQALSIVRESIRNTVQKKYVTVIELDVASGNSLSDALSRYMDSLFPSDIIAMVEVGQESGRLAILLSKIALVYRERLERKLSFITTIMQPLIMVLLGVLVAALIFAVYGPIFTMSSSF